MGYKRPENAGSTRTFNRPIQGGVNAATGPPFQNSHEGYPPPEYRSNKCRRLSIVVRY